MLTEPYRQAFDLLCTVARMKTDGEYGSDGMSGDDAVETLAGLIRQARTITGVESPWCEDCGTGTDLEPDDICLSCGRCREADESPQ